MTHAPSPDLATATSHARTEISADPAKARSGEVQVSHGECAGAGPGSAKTGTTVPGPIRSAAGPSGGVASDAAPPGEAPSATLPPLDTGATQTAPAKTSHAKTRARTPAKRRRAHPRWRDVFLAELAETSNVARAARLAGVDVSTVYKARRTEGEFLRRWHDALAEGYDNLEMELVRRLRSGELDGGGKGTGGTAKRKFDNAVALRLLAAHRETVSRQRGRRAFEDEDAIIASINARLEAMRQRLIAAGTPGLEE